MVLRPRTRRGIRAAALMVSMTFLVIVMLPRPGPASHGPAQAVVVTEAPAIVELPVPEGEGQDAPATLAQKQDDSDDDNVAERRRHLRRPRDPDADCSIVTDVIPQLDELGRQFFSGYGGQYPQCMPMLPPLRKFLPLRNTAQHPRCLTAVLPESAKTSVTGAWKSLDEHMGAIDWEQVEGWKTGAPFLFNRCRPPVAINHWYFDVNPIEVTGGNSVEWFLRHYPEASTFGVHVLSWDLDGTIEARMQALMKDGIRMELPQLGETTVYPKSLHFRLGLPWLQLGFLSQRVLKEATLPPPTLPPGFHAPLEVEPGGKPAEQGADGKPIAKVTDPPIGTRPRDGMVDVLNDRMVPTVYHEMEYGLNQKELADKAVKMRDKLASKYPKFTRTLPAVPLSHYIFEHATEADFVVVRLNAIGFEREVIKNLLETGAMRFVDELMLVCRCREKDFAWNTPTTPADCMELYNTLRTLGVYVHEWFAW